MWKMALNKQTQLEVKSAVAEIINQAITWPPNLPKFIELCQGPQIDTEDAFNRMIDRKPCHGIAEWRSRQDVGFRCKQQLSEGDARKVWRNALLKNIEKVRNGELLERDFNPVQIVSPEVFRDTETQEMRNSRLDAEIAIMLESGTKLIGPYKKRYLETEGK